MDNGRVLNPQSHNRNSKDDFLEAKNEKLVSILKHFFFFLGHAQSMQKVPSQGLNLSHSSDSVDP